MINKKVKEAIDRICSNFDYNTCCYEVKYDDWDTILNYIGKLQQLSDKIRDKKKELEAMAISQDIYYQDVLKLFEDLLGE